MYSYRLYNGLAGDEHLLFTVTHDYTGISEHELINRRLPFYEWRLERLKRKLKRRIKTILPDS